MRNTLAGLLEVPGVVGATLVTRDGICVLNGDHKIPSPETISAMTAALMGAAETAFYELGGGTKMRILAEGETRKMVAVPATAELLLVVIGDQHLSGAEAIKRAEQAAEQLRSSLSEG